jgi:hypothetical protein
LEGSLTQNEWMKQICLLGGGKGKVSKIFFLKGLVKIAHFNGIQAFLDQYDLSIEQLEDFINDA